MQDLIRYMKAMFLLQLRLAEAAAQTGQGPPVRAELLLSDAGFSTKDIAEILGKNYSAVSKAVTRARIARTKELGSAGIQNGGTGNDE